MIEMRFPPYRLKLQSFFLLFYLFMFFFFFSFAFFKIILFFADLKPG